MLKKTHELVQWHGLELKWQKESKVENDLRIKYKMIPCTGTGWKKEEKNQVQKERSKLRNAWSCALARDGTKNTKTRATRFGSHGV